MDVHTLNEEQFEELKSSYFWRDCEESQEQYTTPDEIPDQIIIDYYAGIAFVPEDFFCSSKNRDFSIYTLFYKGENEGEIMGCPRCGRLSKLGDRCPNCGLKNTK